MSTRRALTAAALAACGFLSAAGSAGAATGTFPSATPIQGATGPDSADKVGTADPFPSSIDVAGMTGVLSKATVTLNSVSAELPQDMDVMLVSPGGQKLMLMSDVAGTSTFSGSLSFDDAAPTPAPTTTTPVAGGQYQPTNATQAACGLRPDDDAFDAPAPAGPFVDSFKGLNSATVNGTWQLYVTDDCSGSTNSIVGGWTLHLETNPANVTLPGAGSSGPSGPYPVDLPIAGIPGKVTKVTAKLTGLFHTLPDDVDVLLANPMGQTVVLMSDAGGSSAVDPLNLTFDDGAAGSLPDGSFLTQGTFKPSNFGAEADAYPAPAPAGPYGTTMSALNGASPNGTWRMFLVDDSDGDVGGLAAATVNITTVTPSGSHTTSSVTSTKDTTKPVASLALFGKQTLGDVASAGFITVKLKTSEPASFSGQAIVAAKLAKSLGLPPNGTVFSSKARKKSQPAVVAKGKSTAAKAGGSALKLKLTRKARKRFAKRASVKLQVRVRVTDKAGNRRLVTKRFKLKR